MAKEEKPVQNEQSKPITEQGGQNIQGEQIFEKAMPVQPIPQALTNQPQTTSSTQNQTSGDSNSSGGQTSSSSENSNNSNSGN
ncbi:MAG: hypothetical protein PHF99_12695 [Bacteroidales bacterium]|nr:hypothetical protein [Bacteroidales bacterium]